jgi:hypothetical protein
LIAIVTISKNSGDWSLLNDQVLVLSKKHAQLKQATTRMVQEVMKFLDDTPNLDVKLSVIETLRTVTEGKVRIQTMSLGELPLGPSTDITLQRFSSKLSEPALHVSCPISRRPKATSMPRPTFCASCRWRHLDR